MKNSMWNAVSFLLLIIAGLAFINVISGGRGAAPTPGMFKAGLTVDAAQAQATESSKTVMVVATADWCPPCQVYKKNALVDPEVQAWVDENAEAVLLDVDVDPQAAERLGVRAIPTTILIRDGEVVDRFTGVVSAGELLGKLKAAQG